MMTIDQMIAVLQAARAGKRIEYKQGDSCWLSLPKNIGYWNFVHNIYRVRPELRVFYMNIYPDGSFGRAYENKDAAESNGGRDAKPRKFVEVID